MSKLIELTNTQEVKFEAFSLAGELVKASTTPDGKKMLHGVASSTTKDLHGDTILLSGLEDMERSAVGLTVFLNHSYNVPGDVGGTITKAIIRQKGVDDKGDPNYQLEVDIELEEDNPAALQTWKYIQKGRKLGLSIGAMIPEGGAKRQKDGSYLIEHVMLLELSLVGIPANPKSWVDYAASALRGMIEKSKTTTLGAPTITLEAGRYRIEGSLEGLELDLGADGVAEPVPTIEYGFSQALDGKTLITRTLTWPTDPVTGMTEGQVETLGAWDLSDPDDKIVAIASINEDVIQKATVWVETRDGDKITIGEPDAAASITNDIEPDVTDAGCPTCGGSKGSPKGDCSNGYHSAAAPDPDVTDAKIRIIEVDTDDGSSGDGQGASDSEPDDSLSAPAADITATGEPVILDDADRMELLAQLSFEQLRSIALQTTTELVETKRVLGEEKQARLDAERQRDAAIEAAGNLAQKTAEIIEKIANSPLPRKAAIKSAGDSLNASIEGYYGEAMARAIAGTGK